MAKQNGLDDFYSSPVFNTLSTRAVAIWSIQPDDQTITARDRDDMQSIWDMATQESTIINWQIVGQKMEDEVKFNISTNNNNEKGVHITIRQMVQKGKKHYEVIQGVLTSKDCAVPVTFRTVANGSRADSFTAPRVLALWARMIVDSNAYGLWALDDTKMKIEDVDAGIRNNDITFPMYAYLAIRVEGPHGLMLTGCLCKAASAAAAYTTHLDIQEKMKPDKRDKMVGASKQSKVLPAQVKQLAVSIRTLS